MPVIRLYPHGITAGVPPMTNSHDRALRGHVEGWSHGATRRNTAFLRSVEVDKLTGKGWGVTLTVRDCPPSGAAWAALRKAWVMRMQRAGMIRLHWVTEWQRRGVPHLHGAVWFPESCYQAPEWIEYHWLQLASAYGAKSKGQYVLPISGPVGWFKYLAKHASRGVSHYQRSSAGIPEGWKGATGRVWGKWGDWPVREAVKLETGQTGFVQFRRMVRAWRVAHWRHQVAHGLPTRRAESLSGLKGARRMLKCNERKRSTVRGLSEWIPQDLALSMVGWLAYQGHQVEQVWQDGEGNGDGV